MRLKDKERLRMESIKEILETMWRTFTMIGVMDIIDILIVAFLIYHLIRLVRNTNAMTALKGFGIVLLVMFGASLLQMNTLSWILSNVMQVGLLALVIIFQTELRKMLERLGRSRFPKIFGQRVDEKAMDHVILQTVEACIDMSRTRTGALIIFERNTGLNDEIKSGTEVDAAYNGELLKNIFYEGAPLHDGAVIVRGDRITAAGCMLPLTDNPNLSKELGMRHRAGIGMSENSDAVCVIVSEESGAISVAMDGIIKRHLTPETLDLLLKRELLPPEETPAETKLSGLKKRVFRGGKKE